MSDFTGQGADHGPTYIDVFGTANRLGLEKSAKPKYGSHGFGGPNPDGPFWLRGLRGELPLWVAFWVGFFFGHGIVLAFSIGSLVIGTVLGLTFDPTGLDDAMIAMSVVMGGVSAVMAVFGVWAVISVWRSAAHAEERKWGIAARIVVGLYAVLWGATLWHLVS